MSFMLSCECICLQVYLGTNLSQLYFCKRGFVCMRECLFGICTNKDMHGVCVCMTSSVFVLVSLSESWPQCQVTAQAIIPK